MRMDKAIKGIGLDVSVFVPENQEILDRNSNGEPLVGLSENDEAYAVLNSFAKNKLLV